MFGFGNKKEVQELIKNGNDWYNLRKNDVAISCYDKALKLDRKNEKALTNKAMVLIDLKQYEEALICAEQAIKSDKKSSHAWYNCALAHIGLSDYQKALMELNKTRDIADASGLSENFPLKLFDYISETEKMVEFMRLREKGLMTSDEFLEKEKGMYDIGFLKYGGS